MYNAMYIGVKMVNVGVCRVKKGSKNVGSHLVVPGQLRRVVEPELVVVAKDPRPSVDPLHRRGGGRMGRDEREGREGRGKDTPYVSIHG